MRLRSPEDPQCVLEVGEFPCLVEGHIITERIAEERNQ
jgi:hypothetical protein